MTSRLLDLVARFGYGIVAAGVGIESLGIPVPGETVLVIGAVLAGQGRLSAWGVALSAWLGAVLGDNLGYGIGRRYGRRLTRAPVLRRFYDERRLAAADDLMRRRGWIAVFFGRFVAILRIFAGPLAGMHHMPWWRFVLANALGAAIWVTGVTAVGLALGSNLDRATSLVTDAGYGGLALVLVAAALVVAVVGLRRRARRAEAAVDQDG